MGKTGPKPARKDGCHITAKGRPFIGIELSEEYFEIARTRIKYARAHPEKFDAKKPPKKIKTKDKNTKEKSAGLWEGIDNE